ncbi:MAG: SgcJ/EcaC family oxidoreductase [Caulobacter sp.]|nr:SgcJ/EcaC family oxidoreductase [Caulobacter sp.]
MSDHPLRAVIEACDRAITAEDFDTLMDAYADDAVLVVRPGLEARGPDQIRRAFTAIAEHFKHGLVVRQGKMAVLESGDTALVLMETFLDVPGEGGGATEIRREATYVFRKAEGGRWLCVIDNSYGAALLAELEG